MFERLRKAFSTKAQASAQAEDAPASQLLHAPMTEWASTQGFAFSADGSGHGMALDGQVGGKPWRLQLGKPSRDYIRGEEVRARAVLGIDESVAVLVINRPLKEALQKRAYQMYTDSLQTSVDSSLPEEMRWLSMFEEVGWPELPQEFWQRYAVLAERREQAQAWVDAALARAMLNWPQPGPSAEVPFMLILMNGKAYLRMEYRPADLLVMQHAAAIFTSACEAAQNAFRG